MNPRRRCYDLAHQFLTQSDGEGLGELLYQVEVDALRRLAESDVDEWKLFAEVMDDEPPL